jgi:uncharacterized protein
MDGLPYHLLLLGSGAVAGFVNALAGGGPILTLAVLTLTGMDPRIANLTSTVALSPGQIAAGYSVRDRLRHVRLGSPRLLLVAALAGGAFGAALLLLTSAPLFRAIAPWLVLLATGIYAFSSFPGVIGRASIITGNRQFVALFAPLTVYGGYFGGGNSFMLLALLSVSGHDPKLAGDVKNALIAAINLGAVAIFAASGVVEWAVAVSLGAGGVVGSMVGSRMLGKLPPTVIRSIVIVCGLGLAGTMFAR